MEREGDRGRKLMLNLRLRYRRIIRGGERKKNKIRLKDKENIFLRRDKRKKEDARKQEDTVL